LIGVHVLRLLKAGSAQTIKSAVYFTCLAGVANIVLISLLNVAAQQIASDEIANAKSRLLYLIAAAIYFLSIRASLNIANSFLQQCLAQLRLRIVGKINQSKLRTLEQLGHNHIYAVLAKEGDQLTQNFPMLASAGQSAVTLAFCLLYIAYLSLPAFVVISVSTLGALYLFWSRRRALDVALVAVHHDEAAMHESLTHFTAGFQEVRINVAKRNALYKHFEHIITQLEAVILDVGGRWVTLLMFSNTFIYLLLGVVVFVLPAFFVGHTEAIYKLAATAIFCIGPFTSIILTIPIFSRTNAELNHIFALEKKLETGVSELPIQRSEQPSIFKNFKQIDLKHVCFNYRNQTDEATFSIGPIDMQISRGELIFIRGGNGSGKSTFMKLVCGLYSPDQGSLTVDGILVSEQNEQQYREIFTCIFTDFHLFDRLHGVAETDPERLQALIDLMELGGKVRIQDNRFSTLHLSTGQRKRLAMIVSLLEDNEVFIFDEWAADQDAHFREIFYRQILPELKRRNKTIIAVTHDEQYWHLCDRFYTMDLGLMVVEPNRVPPSRSG
jgi:putative ATP-binding cassette transporter